MRGGGEGEEKKEGRRWKKELSKRKEKKVGGG